MAKNETTSDRVGTLAARGLAGIRLTKKDMTKVFASALTQRPDGVSKRTLHAGPPAPAMAAKKKPKKTARKKAKRK